MAAHPELEAVDGGVAVAVHVVPGAGRTEIVGRHGDALKVRVGASPQGGRANQAVVDLIAAQLDVGANTVSIASGDKSRTKKVLIAGIELTDAEEAVERIMGAPTAGGKVQAKGKSKVKKR